MALKAMGVNIMITVYRETAILASLKHCANAVLVHQPVNDSLTEPLELIVARNAPVEIVVEYDPAEATAAG